MSSSMTQHADVIFESSRRGVQRVVAYPLDMSSSATLQPSQQQRKLQLEKRAGIDPRRQQVRQQHFFTGEVIRGGSGGTAFVPHGTGSLAFLHYAKPLSVSPSTSPSSNTRSSTTSPAPPLAAATASSSSVVSNVTGKGGSNATGIPYAVIAEAYGEVDELREAVILSFALYKGTFTRGRREGRGELTVYPKYVFTCDWNEDIPLLDESPCLIQYLSKPSPPRDDTTINNNSQAGIPGMDDDPTNEDVLYGSINANAWKREVAGYYDGMASLLLLPGAMQPQRNDLVGLTWALQAQFVADGVGEMLTSQGVRHCGCWQMGQRHGFGVEFDPGASTVYMGGFLYDQREGPGTLHYCSTRALLYGNWKEGKLTATANAILPTWPFALQGVLWKSYENWTFEHGTFVRSCGSLSGVWEPLFVAFDEVLANSVVDLQQQQQQQFEGEHHRQSKSLPVGTPSLSTTAATAEEEEGGGGGGSPEEEGTTARKGEHSEESHDELGSMDEDQQGEMEEGEEEKSSRFLALLSDMMRRAEFMAVLAAFQRCYYFLYKPCTGLRSHRPPIEQTTSHRQTSAESIQTLSPSSAPLQSPIRSPPLFHPQRATHDSEAAAKSLVQRLCAFSRHGAQLPVHTGGWSTPSWCDEVCGAESNEVPSASPSLSAYCFHTASIADGLATRMPPHLLFDRATHDLASFVSSIRLRLLSYVAAHPAACDVTVSNRVLAVCWDAAFSLVAPVVLELAAMADAAMTTQTLLALRRCAQLQRVDFVPDMLLHKRRGMVGAGIEKEKEEEVKKEEEVPEELPELRIFSELSKPARHWQRQVVRTSNGPLLLFGAQCLSEVINLPQNAVYPSPAAMFDALAATWREAQHFFPTESLWCERWVCGRLLSAFSSDFGEGVSPCVVLRVLRALTCDVNPHYPCPTEAPMEMEEIMEILDTANAAVKRLQHTFPTIRHCTNDDDGDDDSNVGMGGKNGGSVVYPLDELAIRVRYALLIAAEAVQRRCSVSTRENEKENKSSFNHPEGVKDRIMDWGNMVVPEDYRMHILWALRQPVDAMESALHMQVLESGKGVSLGIHGISEVILWVAECVGSVFGAVNYQKKTQQDHEKRQTQQQQQQQQSLLLDGRLRSPTKEHVMENSHGRQNIFQWKLFLPNITAHREAPTSDMDASEEQIPPLHSSPSSPSQQQPSMTTPLTDGEVVQLAIIQRVLADIGVRVALEVQFCFDNEDDVLLTFESSQSAVTRCIGREATLSLKVADDFFGTLVWETVENAWLTALLTLRTMSSPAQQHAIWRRTARTESLPHITHTNDSFNE